MKRKWLPVDAQNAGRMIHLLDKDHDGAVDLEEFKAFAALLPEAQASPFTTIPQRQPNTLKSYDLMESSIGSYDKSSVLLQF